MQLHDSAIVSFQRSRLAGWPTEGESRGDVPVRGYAKGATRKTSNSSALPHDSSGAFASGIAVCDADASTPSDTSTKMTDYVRRIRALIGPGEVLQLPSVSVAIRDAAGRVLLARHVEGNRWLLPGGSVEPGETPADAALREAWEETGPIVRLTRLVGVFGGPDFVVS
jgi:hypothetical protein